MSDLSLALTFKLVDQVSKELKQIDRDLSKITDKWERVGFALGSAFKVGVTAAVGGLALLVKSSIDTAEAMGEMAQKAGVSTEAFSALAYAAKTAGADRDTLKQGLKGINEALVDSQDKSSKAAGAFKYLSIETKNADGTLKKADVVFKEMADRFSKMPDGANKTALAMDLMKKSGTELIPTLNLGAGGLADLTTEAENFNQVITDEQAARADAFNDSIERLGSAASGAGMALAMDLLPALELIVERATDGGSALSSILSIIRRAVASTLMVVNMALEALSQIIRATYIVIVKGITQIGNALRGNWAQILKDNEVFTQAQKDSWDLYIKNSKEFADTMRLAGGFDNETTRAMKAKLAQEAALKKAAKDKAEEARKAAAAQADYDRKLAANEAAAAKRAEHLAERRKKLFDDTIADLNKIIEGTANLTTAEQVLWEIENGRYKDLDANQKNAIKAKLVLVDAVERQIIYEKQLAESSAKNNKQVNDAINSYAELVQQYEDTIALGPEQAAVNEKTRGDVAQLNAEYVQLTATLEQLNAAKTKDTKSIRDTEIRLKAVGDELASSGSSSSATFADINQKTSVISRNLATWKKYIGDAKNAAATLNAEEAELWRLLELNKITTEEFSRAMKDIDVSKLELARDKLTDLEKKMVDVANEIQGTFSSFFYDAMQGQFGNIFTSFKQMLDKMVAEALAAQLANALFGDLTKNAGVSGSGGAFLSGLFKMFGFRESGGSVQAGQPYIVGEKRAEVFVPSTNGTIIPSLEQAGGMMSSNNTIQLAITAMDSQDVIRALDKIKRPLAEMVNGTTRAYNLGR